ncbi:MAG: ABC transporter six-transmembrane domain-containing protein [Ferruginibacter sp.]
MSRIFIIRNIFLKHKYQLLVTYILFGLEMTGLLLRPLFFGMAVNGLIERSYNGLILLAGSHLLYTIVGTIRHRYDTRTYSAIYTSLVTRLLGRHFEGAEVSKLSAHSTLAREFIDFLEYDLNYVIEACYNLFGSIILLCFFDKKVVFVCLLVLVPVMIISYFYGRRMRRLNKAKNDELENQVNIISTRDKKQIAAHYQNLRRWQIKISDKEAWNFGIMELFAMLVLCVSVLVSVKKGSTPMVAGDLIGIYYYVMKFTNGLDTIPYMGQRLASLKDIIQRIEIESDEKTELPKIKPVLRPIVNREITTMEMVS